MLQSLGGRQEGLITRERALLESLIEFLTGFGAPAGDIDLLRQTLSDMGDPFMLVVVGEFNSGKSAFINALVGHEIAAEGSLPTTERVTILKHSPEMTLREQPGGVVEKGFPSDFLHAISIVDTPGTNAVIRHHEELSREFVPRSDLVLFVTSAERPMTESEREYMELIRDWGKKIILVVSKVDVLREDERDQMHAFVQEQVRLLLGLAPPVFMVSARTARKAKDGATTDGDRARLMRESGFDRLEEYVGNLMGDRDLTQLKLQSPLGVAEELIRRYRGASEERAKILEEDAKVVRDLDSLLGSYRDDTRRDFGVRLAQLELVVKEINERADAWFEANSGIRTSLFGRRGDLQERFREEVVAGTGEVVNKRVRELVNWLVYRQVKQWRQISDYMNLHRKADLTRRMAGEVADGFDQRREELLETVSGTASATVEGYDYQREAERLADSLRGAAVQTATSEAGARGLGEEASELARTETLDITGTTLALLVTGMELSARPGRKAREEFRGQTDALRERLNAAVQQQLEKELEGSVARMRETLSPYSGFVSSELTRMRFAESILGKIGAGAGNLRQATDVPAEPSQNNNSGLV